MLWNLSIKGFSFPVIKETQPCQYCEIERSNQRKWPVILCVWVHEGELVPDDERQVNGMAVILYAMIRKKKMLECFLDLMMYENLCVFNFALAVYIL